MGMEAQPRLQAGTRQPFVAADDHGVWMGFDRRHPGDPEPEAQETDVPREEVAIQRLPTRTPLENQDHGTGNTHDREPKPHTPLPTKTKMCRALSPASALPR